HREELVHQPIKYYDCECGVEQGEETSHGEEVVSASVQSLIRRLERFSPDEFDTIITDEAHHAAAPSYRKIYNYFRPRLHVGFTATPNRGDKVRLDSVYDEIIFQRDLKWGINNGWLTDVRCLRVKVSYNVSKVKRRLGDFVAGELDKAVNTAPANREVAEIYKKYARGQTLIFAASVSHAENIAAGIEGAVVVSQKTPNRAEIIKKFTERKIPCIVNCMIFTEGTDLPLIETIIIARPTQNPSLYTQMVGRGLRRAEGKQYLTLIDCVGVSGKLDICTAPSLMGLDVSAVPESRMALVEGMLTEMQGTIERACDCAETWMFNVQAVNLFAKEQGVDVRKINWTKKSNGDLVYQFTNGDRIGVKAMNELGKTKVMSYCFDEKQDKFVYSETEEMTLQQALDAAYARFFAHYRDEEKLWNLTEYYSWQFEPASEKQKAFLRSKLPPAEWEAINASRHLTKGDAAQILNAMSLKDMSPKRLLAMRRKSNEEKQAKEEENRRLSSLKIRYMLTKKKYPRKYYAIRMPDDLLITDDWEKAKLVIEGVGEANCRFKGFLSLDDAVKFLRGR
ncbi:MAG: DEAD/DEAH box helicase family protein, partial [Clostridia bacterium]|nr:DEAD/DEAH box helicase family protein [Clostridia bacterium]